MAETAPWLVPQTASGGAVAPWLAKEPEVGTGEDIAKGAISGTAQGVIGLPGFGGDLQNLAKAGAGKAGLTAHDPLGWVTHKLEENFPNAMKFMEDSNAKSANAPIKQIHSGDMPVDIKLPSSADIQGTVEQATGPFYQAQTPLGKAAQTAGQVLPALATGGETLPGLVAKSVGAGLVSEGAGETAKALKSHLPEAAQPYAEPVARAVGAGAGVFAPAAARRAFTPLPLEAGRAADLAKLPSSITDQATAGQFTDSPRLMTAEGRTSKFAGQPENQDAVLTQEAMGHAGAPGSLATPETLANLGGKTPGVQGLGEQIGTIRSSNEINPAEFPVLKQELAGIRKQHANVVGKDNAQALSDIENEIALGAQNNPGNASMRGPRYQYMRQRLQSAIDNGATGTDQTALSGFRDALDRAFHRSITPEESGRLKDLERQYTNYDAISNRSNPEGKVTMDPSELRSVAASKYGNKSANANADPLSNLADNAKKVMQPLPPRNTEISPITQTLAGVGNSLIHGAAGVHYGGPAAGLAGAGEGFLGGLFGAEPAVNAGKDMMARILASKYPQKYLRNQMWTPGASTSSDPSMLVRLLMSPPEKPLIASDSRK